MLDALKNIAKEQAEDQMKIYQTIIEGSVMAANAIKNIGSKGNPQMFNLKPPKKPENKAVEFDREPLDEMREDIPIKETALKYREADRDLSDLAGARYAQIKELQEQLRAEKLSKQESVEAAGLVYSTMDAWRNDMETVGRNLEISIKQFMEMKANMYKSHMELFNALKAKD
jgi:hypothetical protein